MKVVGQNRPHVLTHLTGIKTQDGHALGSQRGPGAAQGVTLAGAVAPAFAVNHWAAA